MSRRRLVTWLSVQPAGRLAGLFAVATLVPLALLGYLSLRLASDALRTEARARVTGAASAAAGFMDHEVTDLARLVDSYARRPVVVEAVAGRDPARSTQLLRGSLRELEARDGIGQVVAVGRDGETIGRGSHAAELAPGVERAGWLAQANSLRRAAVFALDQPTGNSSAIVAAAPVRAPGSQRPRALLVATFDAGFVRDLSAEAASSVGMQIRIADESGAVIGASLGPSRGGSAARSIPESLSDATLRFSDQGDELVAHTPLASLGWTLSASRSKDEALAPLETLRGAVLPLAGVLALVMAAAFVLLLLALRERGRAAKELLRREENTRAIIEAAKDAFVSMDSRGEITGWNAQAEEVFGWSCPEALGRRLADTIIPEQYREAHERGLERFLSTGEGPVLETRFEIEALHRDGRTFPVELVIWPVRTEEDWSFNAFIHDISERRRAQEELRAARDQAMGAARMKSEFLANMSHEIRTPLNGVIGMTSLLLETELSPEQREYTETIKNSGEALLAVINDILDFSKIESGRMDLEVIDFDFRSVVEEVADVLGEAAYGKGLELATYIAPDVPQGVSGDPVRLRQVLFNLVGNAVKFTDEGEIVVRVSVRERRPERVDLHVEVTDTGIGMSPEVRQRLFQSFAQADASTTRRFGGTGLGLAITKQLVELMGGAIGVKSQAGEGSTFYFTMPFAVADGTVKSPGWLSTEGLRVLVVDDNATNRTIMEQTLGQWGVRASSAREGEEALELLREAALRKEGFAAALLDFHMPGMDGIELARRIKTDPLTSDIPLALITSSGQRAEAREAAAAGIEAYLTKPVRQSTLHDVLATVLGIDRRHAPQRVVAAPKRGPRGWLLLVEDNPVNQKVAVQMLRKLGHRVDVASNGVEALDAIARETYSAVLMDCQMPVMDGYEATRRIRALDTPASGTPVIAMTAAALDSDRELAEQAGMDDYITKPVKLDELEAVLERWLARGSPAARDPGAAATEHSPAEHPSASRWADKPVIDRSLLRQLEELDAASGDDTPSFVTEFLTNAVTTLADLRSAVAAGDTAAVRLHAHSLKGSTATLGARRTSAACAELEALAENWDHVGAQALLDAVTAELDRAAIELGLPQLGPVSSEGRSG